MERIVEGITPIQRARFIFQAPPASFLQLEKLAMVDRNIAYADQSRAARPAEVTIRAIESQPKPENLGILTLEHPHLRGQVNLLSVTIAGSQGTHRNGVFFGYHSCVNLHVLFAKSQARLGIRCRKIARFVTSLAPV